MRAAPSEGNYLPIREQSKVENQGAENQQNSGSEQFSDFQNKTTLGYESYASCGRGRVRRFEPPATVWPEWSACCSSYLINGLITLKQVPSR